MVQLEKLEAELQRLQEAQQFNLNQEQEVQRIQGTIDLLERDLDMLYQARKHNELALETSGLVEKEHLERHLWMLKSEKRTLDERLDTLTHQNFELENNLEEMKQENKNLEIKLDQKEKERENQLDQIQSQPPQASQSSEKLTREFLRLKTKNGILSSSLKSLSQARQMYSQQMSRKASNLDSKNQLLREELEAQLITLDLFNQKFKELKMGLHQQLMADLPDPEEFGKKKLVSKDHLIAQKPYKNNQKSMGDLGGALKTLPNPQENKLSENTIDKEAKIDIPEISLPKVLNKRVHGPFSERNSFSSQVSSLFQKAN